MSVQYVIWYLEEFPAKPINDEIVVYTGGQEIYKIQYPRYFMVVLFDFVIL